MSDNQQPQAGGLQAKTSSHIAQIVAALWIAGWSAYKFIVDTDGVEVSDILLSGIGIAACFLPVYFSIIMDKIKDIKIGGV